MPRLRISAPSATPDEWGMVLTALTVLAGVGGLSTRLGLTPDDVTLIVGALGFLATATRTIVRRRARTVERRRTERFTRYGDIPLAKGGQLSGKQTAAYTKQGGEP